MIKKTFIYGAIQLLISFIIALYLQSISDKSLIFTEGILDNELRNSLIKHYFIVLSFLGLLNLLFYYLSHRNNEKKKDEKLYNNICQIIFEEFISSEPNFQNHEFRVSLFMKKEGLIFLRQKWWFRQTTFLSNVGRYQTRQEKKLSKIKFLPNEGCIGICYTLGTYFFDNTCEFNSTNPSLYYQEQLTKFNIPNFKAKKVTSKSRSFVSCPIKYFNSQDLFGVIVVDSTMDIDFNNTNFRIIEDVLKHNSVIFNNPN
ncbi:hypothetical protein [Flavobacterium sp. PL02]|uniref:hypothetical protein n=1 Tax=Flavobacterium sp. PL02 TaxID=3088354 RepID=UPI002B23B5DD|nr:hypothetical protein [Flavobacterium sp. PL02]MEA9413723.1 hypothetical protein [Flavobacterium sp. PL02]